VDGDILRSDAVGKGFFKLDIAQPKPSEATGQQTEDTLPIESQVKDRFGILPNFFRLNTNTPDIRANLWGFAQAAFLDNPLPSLFKERLFVHLSRFSVISSAPGRDGRKLF
jgi:hypothetical protein